VKHAGLYITEYQQTYSEVGLAQSKLWPVGTLCITIAANIADTAILAIEACFPDSVIGFVPDPAEADARFVK
jgi:type I restriction enzyme S subunit